MIMNRIEKPSKQNKYGYLAIVESANSVNTELNSVYTNQGVRLCLVKVSLIKDEDDKQL